MTNYRSKKTQEVHDKIKAVFYCPSVDSAREVISELKKLVPRLSHNELCEVSTDGRSLLTDTLFMVNTHRGYTLDRGNCKEFGTQITTILNSALKREPSPEEHRRQLNFLLPTNQRGNSVVHQLYFWSVPDRVKWYFNLAEKIISTGKVDKAAFIEALLDNPEGTSPLQKAICAGNGDSVRLYLNYVKNDQSQRRQYANLLLKHKMTSRQSNICATPLFDASCSGATNPDNPVAPGIVSDESASIAYFEALNEAYDNHWITRDEYRDLLTQRRRSGYITPLQKIAESSYPLVIKAYLNALERVLTQYELRDFLFGVNPDLNKEEFSSLHDILCHRNNKLLPLYFEFVDRVLNADEANDLLKKPTKRGRLTPLFKVLDKENHMDNVNLYFDRIESRLTKEQYTQLVLTAYQSDGNSSLLRALSTGHEPILRRYFQSIRTALDKGWLTRADYAKLFCELNHAGYSTSLQALYSENPGIARFYFAQINEAHEQGLLSSMEYAKLLCGFNPKNHITPFQQAFSSNNVAVVDVYTETLDRALQKQWITREQYEQALCTANKDSFSALLCAFSKKDVVAVQRCLDILRKAFDNQWISKAGYANSLLQKSAHGFAPIFDALRSKNPRIFMDYSAAVQRAYHEGIIDARTYIRFLLDTERHNGTPLCFVLKEGLTENIETYFGLLKDGLRPGAMTSVELTDFLKQPNDIHFTPLELALKAPDTKHLQLFHAFIKEAREAHHLSNQQYCEVLFPTGQGGFNALHDVCKSNNFENIRFYFQTLFHAYRHLKIITRADYENYLFARTQAHKHTFFDIARQHCTPRILSQLEAYLQEELTPAERSRVSPATHERKGAPAFFDQRQALDRQVRSSSKFTGDSRQIRELPQPRKRGAEEDEDDEGELVDSMQHPATRTDHHEMMQVEAQRSAMNERIKIARLELEEAQERLRRMEAERSEAETHANRTNTQVTELRTRAQREVADAQHARHVASQQAQVMHRQAAGMFAYAAHSHAVASFRAQQATHEIHHAEMLTATAQNVHFQACMAIQEAEVMKEHAAYAELVQFQHHVKDRISGFLKFTYDTCPYQKPDGRKTRAVDHRKGQEVGDLIIPIVYLRPVSADQVFNSSGKDREVNCWAIECFPGEKAERIHAFKGQGEEGECCLFLTLPKPLNIIQSGLCCLYPSRGGTEWTILQNNQAFHSKDYPIEILPHFPSMIVSEKDGTFIESSYQQGIFIAWPTIPFATAGAAAAVNAVDGSVSAAMEEEDSRRGSTRRL